MHEAVLFPACAVTVAVPPSFAVTVTLEPVDALSETEEPLTDHETVVSVAVRGSTVAVIFFFSPFCIINAVLSSAMPSTGTTVPAGPTFTVHEAVFAPSVVRTVTVAVSPEEPVPSDTALTVPSSVTVTISVSLDSHFTDLSDALSGLTVAISCSDVSTSSVSVDLLSVTPLTRTTCGESLPPPELLHPANANTIHALSKIHTFPKFFITLPPALGLQSRILFSIFSMIINDNYSTPLCQSFCKTRRKM